MINETLVLKLLNLTLFCFGLGALASLALARRAPAARWTGHMLALLGAGSVGTLAVAGLAGGTAHWTLSGLLPFGGVVLGIDRLSAFFLLIIAVGGFPASLYALGYTRAYESRHSLGAMACTWNLFLATMTLVVLARNVLTFLVLWEAMSLVSYFLVLTESDHAETQHAGLVYLVMTHAGFACLLMGFLLLAHATGTMDFAHWRAATASLGASTRHAIFILLALGFGAKAGVIPLHIWLPQAHPAAPSHVSAVMSGVMIKLGIYGLIRLGFDWLGIGPAVWGGAILAVAAVSAVLGVLYALMEQDLKRLLAYSSVENVGIILLGIGAGLLFQAYHLPGLAALALLAGLYHTLNHAAFKSLLFMTAGAVVQATHTRHMEAMGGLIKRMPQTALFFLVGSVAIAALPPFNGFFSEWLTFQSLLLSWQIPARDVNLIFALAIAALALTSGLAAACFVKAFGITFLALPRSDQAGQACEVSWVMRAGMALLALACLALGIWPVGVLYALQATIFEMNGAYANLYFDWKTVVANPPFATVAPLLMACALAALLAAIPLALRLRRGRTVRRYYETWGCGRALQTARFEYTSTAFANPFKRVFAFLYRPIKELDIEFHPESRFFVRTIAYRNEVRSVFEEALYQPLIRSTQWIAEQARRLQSGNVQSYLLYILIALVILILLAR